MTFLKRNSDAKFLVVSDNQRCSLKSPDKKSELVCTKHNARVLIKTSVDIRLYYILISESYLLEVYITVVNRLHTVCHLTYCM